MYNELELISVTLLNLSLTGERISCSLSHLQEIATTSWFGSDASCLLCSAQLIKPSKIMSTGVRSSAMEEVQKGVPSLNQGREVVESVKMAFAGSCAH